MRRHVTFESAIILLTATVAIAAELPDGAVLLDPDVVWDIDQDVVSEIWDPSFAISPDDKTIAYIKGAIWKCSVTAGPPTKFVDLPNTKTAYLAEPGYRGVWSNISRPIDQHIFLGRLPREMIRVCSLAWTPSQDGIVFGTRRHWQSNAETAHHDVIHVSTDGVVSTITTIQREKYDEPHALTSFHVTNDKKHVIVSSGYTPLIWDVLNGRPRATCFDRLLPSATSGRFLGIEIDTRQLVIADENFKITNRFEVTFQPRRTCDLVWSRDERFAICRTRFDHPSEKWSGLRIDLETGEQRALEGPYFSERWVFTGHGGEAIRTGKTQDFFGVYANGGGGGTYISIVPDGDGEERDVYRFSRPRKEYESNWRGRGRYPPVRISRDCKFSAMALPRDAGKPGYRYFLLDRDGKRWPLSPNDDEALHVSPYRVIAIANSGQTIVACNETGLFSIPVAIIKGDQRVGK